MLSKIDLINWKLNERINPKTNRKISPKGKVYKKLQESYNKIFKLDLSKIEDHIDIISQDRFIIFNNNSKKWVYENLDNVVFYQEENVVRAFTETSLNYLKKMRLIFIQLVEKKYLILFLII